MWAMMWTPGLQAYLVNGGREVAVALDSLDLVQVVVPLHKRLIV